MDGCAGVALDSVVSMRRLLVGRASGDWEIPPGLLTLSTTQLSHLRDIKSTRNTINTSTCVINAIGVKYERCNGCRKEAMCRLRCSIRSEPAPRPIRSYRSNVGGRYR